ncbi:M23 family metallopeptidase [Streptomyces poonensis]|uniref:Peptidase n=1 Tax=Streptomyces poonensis TaxID=68255 RepID=A0A918PY49_9ACTN|nr:M23 family metallopeptidase [Streptomyces poonensis]GGZ24786.1 peptidase [Streptomyces poonensis]GLJ93623.1 peptidase [Streptomyces poonensis]
MSDRKLALWAFRCLLTAPFVLMAADLSVGLADDRWWWYLLPLVPAWTVVIVMNRRGGTPDRRPAAREPVEVSAPVTGRWSALNSPADRAPSHGTHAYGQTFAIDLVAEPEPGARPSFRWLWPIVRRNRDFPAFGAPLLAVADATVVRATDTRRDHLSRTSLPAVLYLMLVEGAVREMGGVGNILGNHVVLDLGNGVYAAYAHVRRGSLIVREGDRLRAGQVLARCGNSGNSSEPHLHFQLMDGPDPDTARGIPFRWHGIGVPRNGEVFEAPAETSAEASARA